MMFLDKINSLDTISQVILFVLTVDLLVNLIRFYDADIKMPTAYGYTSLLLLIMAFDLITICLLLCS